MKKIMILIVLLCFIPAIAAAECVSITGGEMIDSDTQLCTGEYVISKTIEIMADNIVFDCGDAVLKSTSPISALLVKGRSGVTITNCEITGFANAIYLEGAEGNTIARNKITDNNNGIVIHNSPDNIIEQNIYLNNQRNVFEFTTEQKDDTAEEIPEEEMQVIIELEQNEKETEDTYNEIKELFSHHIRQSENFIDINRTIVYNAADNSTTVKILITSKNKAINYSYYEKIPKCMARYAKEIIFKDSNYEVIMDDPLIMWGFADPIVQEEIEYQLKDKQLTEECERLLEGFGFATGFEDIEKESNLGIFIGIILTVLVIFGVIYVKKME